MMKTLILLCGMLYVGMPYGAPVAGATYYVSPNGNNSNDGSSAAPWLTIGKCASTLLAGDTCVVNAGIYTETVTVATDGSAGNLITYRSATAHAAIVRGVMKISGDYITVDGFRVELQAGTNRGFDVSGNHVTVTNAHISTLSSSLGLNPMGISLTGTSDTASGNYITGTCYGILLLGADHIAENNEVEALTYHNSAYVCGDGDYLRFFGSGHIIRNNYFHGVDMKDPGLAHVDCFQTFDNGGPQYAVSKILIEGNRCQNMGQGAMLEGKYQLKSTDITFRNNVFISPTAFCVYAIDITNVHFFNNTCDTTGSLHGLWCARENGPATCEFKNNIIYGNGTLYALIGGATSIDGDASAPGKNNLLYRIGTTITGYANDVTNVLPLFVGSGNYKLQPGSPARDAGVTIPGWSNATDHDGVARPSGKGWDIGAYEYNAAPATPTGVRIVK